MDTSSSVAEPQASETSQDEHEEHDGEMPCPICRNWMPDLKGGKATICAVCGFKDSCCY